MSTELKQHYLKRIRKRYINASKKQKSLILDEFCEVCEIVGDPERGDLVKRAN